MLLYVGAAAAVGGLGYYFMGGNSSDVKGRAQEMEGKAKGMMSNAEGNAKGMMGDVEGKAKGMMHQAEGKVSLSKPSLNHDAPVKLDQMFGKTADYRCRHSAVTPRRSTTKLWAKPSVLSSKPGALSGPRSFRACLDLVRSRLHTDMMNSICVSESRSLVVLGMSLNIYWLMLCLFVLVRITGLPQTLSRPFETNHRRS